MRIHTECIRFENRCTISSSYDFQLHQQHSQRWCFSQTALQWFNMLPGAPRCTWRPLHQSSKLGPIARGTGSVKFSVRGYEVPSEPSELSGTPRWFWRKLQFSLMLIDTIRICLPEQSRVLWRSDVLSRRASFNPRLLANLTIHNFWRHRIWSTSVLIFWVVTLQCIFRRVFVSGSGVIYTQGRNINTWVLVDPVALEEGQEVEC